MLYGNTHIRILCYACMLPCMLTAASFQLLSFLFHTHIMFGYRILYYSHKYHMYYVHMFQQTTHIRVEQNAFQLKFSALCAYMCLHYIIMPKWPMKIVWLWTIYGSGLTFISIITSWMHSRWSMDICIRWTSIYR